jgi:DNA-binding MarR family transcriptional regulator
MAFDSIVANAGRLRILTSLAAEGRQEFVQLRRATDLTDGNLSAHARRLEGAGLVAIEKSFRGGKPVTTIHLTDDGRQRLTAHVRALVAAVGDFGAVPQEQGAGVGVVAEIDEEWGD